MEELLKILKNHNETASRHAVEDLEAIGESCFDAVADLLPHPVARWHVIPLLMRISPARAIPLLLEIVNRNRENSVKFKEHAKKYIRIKAINAIGFQNVRGDHELEALYGKYQVVDALAYFIDPTHLHKHQEVIIAVENALARIDSDRAREILKLWHEDEIPDKRNWTLV